jgi:ATP-dependent 26S proteasome regulatory subunit
VAVEVPRLRRSEQRDLWRRCLGRTRPAAVDEVMRAFDLSAVEIASVAATAASADTDLAGWLWDACRRQTRPALEGLSQRVSSGASFADLVLPDDQFEAVRSIVAHAPHRFAVAETFEATERGHGLVALLCGPSGTGKTLAAEAIANELSLDLFRVDLASVVSKWVGETEKHLRTILDAADRGSAVLLFDEADALFGKRSEVHDSQDRFANIEVGYLLQRLESYRGIALLTTNLRSVLDTAFTRRIRYVVQFPHPDAALRARIWRRIFPDGVEVEGLDFERLALLDLVGGSIHNIAVHAALDAAAEGGPVTVEHVRRGTVREYAKLDRPLTRTEAVGLR